MSAPDERGALDPPLSLFEHAARLHERYPTGPLPRGGCPYPDGKTGCGTSADRKGILKRTLTAFWSTPTASVQSLHDDLAHQEIPYWIVDGIVKKAPAPDPQRARDTGLWLVRHGTDRRAVTVGLALLAGTAASDDASLIRTIGLLDLFGPRVVTTR